MHNRRNRIWRASPCSTAQGVVFEEYDGTNGPMIEGGVARPDGGASAWFKDSEDNILNLNDLPPGISLDS